MDGLLGVLGELKEMTPDQNLWEVFKKYFFGGKGTSPVCPTAMIDLEYNFIMNMEAMSEKYSTLPHEGGLLSQPNKLIECFTLIQDARANYDRSQQEERNEKAKKGQKGG